MNQLGIDTVLQGGKYRIEKSLGQGGFGITYLAVQTLLNRKVAIKEFFMKDYCSRDMHTHSVLTTSADSDSQVVLYKKKFIKEAKNLAKLHHPNIINVMDIFEENNTFYYVMPYLSNGSLQDFVKLRGILTEKDSIRYLKQIAFALKYMHEEQHICHYDVKPANILLDDDDNAVLIDFGISKNYDPEGHETTATPVGMSEGYSPIEQYQQNMETFSPASDIYSLGATLYFLLHGEKPVSAVQRAEGENMFIDESISPKVKEIIKSSMMISRRNRPQNMDVFIDANRSVSTKMAWSDVENTAIINSNTKIRQEEKQTSSKYYPSHDKGNGLWILLVIGIIAIAIAYGFYVKNQKNMEPAHIEKANYQDYFEK